jgi:hypothetical protein
MTGATINGPVSGVTTMAMAGCTASGNGGANANGFVTTASGTFGPNANGYGATASGTFGPNANGYGATASGHNGANANGFFTTASGDNGASANGRWAVASNDSAHVWSGQATVTNRYGSHGIGTYNIDPVGGAAGVYIGEETLEALLAAAGGTSLVIEASSSIAIVTNGVTRTPSVKPNLYQPTNSTLTTLAAGTATPILGSTSTKAAAGDHAHTYTDCATFTLSGALATSTGALRWYAPAAIQLVDATAAVGTAPVGTNILCTVVKNGSITTCSPSIAAAANVGSAATATNLLAATDYLTVNVTQVGTTTAGSDLTVRIRYGVTVP